MVTRIPKKLNYNKRCTHCNKIFPITKGVNSNRSKCDDCRK